MSLSAIIWLAFAAIACVMLFSLVRREQARIHDLLETYLAEQKKWVKKKAKATRMAQRAAKRKEAEEAAFLKSQKSALAQADIVARQMDDETILSSELSAN